jgi:NAD(P)-dependent dehydrogenase (short-subunit alcohol dehydrogenase family)
MAGRLEGKVAVVTGGASGIGRGCALRFAEEGADLVIADLDARRAAEVARAVEKLGRRALVVQTDTSREEDCEALASATVRELGRVDVVVAAAGISHAGYVSAEPASPRGDASDGSGLLDKPLEHWRKVLDVNLTGVLLTDRALARRMIERGVPGSIINIASGAARIAVREYGDYCVSKAGVWMLTKVLALELSPRRIRVNAIGPGWIETPMSSAELGDVGRRRALEQRIPLGRIGTPLDVANAALYLASEESGYLTGEILYPDGGIDAASR